MLIPETLSIGSKMLKNALEAEILLAHVLGVPRERFISHPEQKISVRALKKFKDFCGRRSRGEPIAYIIGKKEFFGLEFYVDKRALIPRPETEILVEEAMRKAMCGADAAGKPNSTEKRVAVRICDVGTGCGCIAIALAKNIRGARLTAIDISKPALQVAKKNCALHGIGRKVKLVQSNLLAKVIGEKFDVIVANLPYIATGREKIIQPEVEKYEPHIALFAGQDGMKFFKKLFAQVKKMPSPPGWLILEIGFKQKQKLNRLAGKFFPKAHLEWKKDLAGITRALVLGL